MKRRPPSTRDAFNLKALTDAQAFQEAVDAFRVRSPMTKEAFDRLDADQRQRAFEIAGTTQADVIQMAFDQVAEAIDGGTSLDEFKRQVQPTLVDAWAGSVANPPARVENIYRTNLITNFGVGQWAQIHDPAVKKHRPYIRSSDVRDNRETEKICKPIGTVILPADHPWWRTHWSPLHYQCRRSQVSLSEEEAVSEGITDHPPDVDPMPGFGRSPHGMSAVGRVDTTGYDPAIRDVMDGKERR